MKYIVLITLVIATASAAPRLAPKSIVSPQVTSAELLLAVSVATVEIEAALREGANDLAAALSENEEAAQRIAAILADAKADASNILDEAVGSLSPQTPVEDVAKVIQEAVEKLKALGLETKDKVNEVVQELDQSVQDQVSQIVEALVERIRAALAPLEALIAEVGAGSGSAPLVSSEELLAAVKKAIAAVEADLRQAVAALEAALAGNEDAVAALRAALQSAGAEALLIVAPLPGQLEGLSAAEAAKVLQAAAAQLKALALATQENVEAIAAQVSAEVLAEAKAILEQLAANIEADVRPLLDLIEAAAGGSK